MKAFERLRSLQKKLVLGEDGSLADDESREYIVAYIDKNDTYLQFDQAKTEVFHLKKMFRDAVGKDEEALEQKMNCIEHQHRKLFHIR